LVIPHLSSLLCATTAEVIQQSEVIVVGIQSPEFVEALSRTTGDQIVIDLVRLAGAGSQLPADCRSLCW